MLRLKRMDDIFDVLPDDIENILKHYIVEALRYHITESNITDKEKIECIIIKKYIQYSSINKIFELIDFDIDVDNKIFTMNFTDEMKLYVDNEYKKYEDNK